MKIIVPRWRGGVRRPWVRTVLAIGSATALAAAALASVAPTASAAETYSTPAMAVAAGNTVIAVQTQSDGLRFYWNQYGTNTWRGEQVAADGTALSAPDITADGNGVIISVEGPNQSLDFYWQTDGTSTWHEETVAGANSTYSAPRLATIGNSVGIVAQGPQNSLIYYWAANGTSTWTAEWVGGYNTTYSAPDIARGRQLRHRGRRRPVQQPGVLLAAGRHHPLVPRVCGRGWDDLLRPGHHRQRRQRQHRRGRAATTPWTSTGSRTAPPRGTRTVIAAETGGQEDPDITTMNHGSGDGVCVSQARGRVVRRQRVRELDVYRPGMWFPGSDRPSPRTAAATTWPSTTAARPGCRSPGTTVAATGMAR